MDETIRANINLPCLKSWDRVEEFSEKRSFLRVKIVGKRSYLGVKFIGKRTFLVVIFIGKRS